MADEQKTTSKASASTKKEETELSPADREIHGPAAPVAVKVKYPAAVEVSPEEGEEPAESPVVVTIDGEETEVDNDLAGRIVTFASSTLEDHPSHQSPAWSNPALRSPTEEEIEADRKNFDKRFG
jgi:hypothetical protein